MDTKKTPEELRAAKAKQEEARRRKQAEALAESKQRALEEFNAALPARLNAAVKDAHKLGFDPEVTLDDNGPVVTFDFHDGCGATEIRTVKTYDEYAPGLMDLVESRIFDIQEELRIRHEHEDKFETIKARLTPEERGIIREFYNRL